jgi:hypothetical protein
MNGVKDRTHLLRNLKCLNGAHKSTSWQKSSIFLDQHRRHDTSSSFGRCLRTDLRSILSCLLIRRQPCRIFHLVPLFLHLPSGKEEERARKNISPTPCIDPISRGHQLVSFHLDQWARHKKHQRVNNTGRPQEFPSASLAQYEKGR